ncbi:hypothetical protein [Paenibacillus sp. FSL W7-1332]|uniref:hypothetical protein n=1 Tax=Paenibacillus sp. FSL W7-1332 TaxID=2921702 RepID=UPI0030D62ADF
MKKMIGLTGNVSLTYRSSLPDGTGLLDQMIHLEIKEVDINQKPRPYFGVVFFLPGDGGIAAYPRLLLNTEANNSGNEKRKSINFKKGVDIIRMIGYICYIPTECMKGAAGEWQEINIRKKPSTKF